VEYNPFDIIKVLADDSLAWVESAEELSAARIRVWELLADSPGEYIVFNQDTKTLVAHFSIHEAPQVPEWWRQEDDFATPQPVLATASGDTTADDDFGDEFGEFVHTFQPAVA